jgi:hypothetical protein
MSGPEPQYVQITGALERAIALHFFKNVGYLLLILLTCFVFGNCSGLYMNNWGAAGETGICGVTQVSDRCKYYPTRVPLVKPVPNPTSSFSSDTIAIEVAGHSTYFFPKRNGQTVYEEFQYFDMSALHELESADRYAAMLFEHPLPPFGAAKNNETHPHIYVAQSILANGAIFTLEWNLKPPAQQGVLYVVQYVITSDLCDTITNQNPFI